MEEFVNIKSLLFTWKNQYGGKIPGNSSERQAAFLVLFESIALKGKNRKEVREIAGRNEAMIQKECCWWGPHPRCSRQTQESVRHKIDQDFQRALSKYDPDELGEINEDTIKFKPLPPPSTEILEQLKKDEGENKAEDGEDEPQEIAEEDKLPVVEIERGPGLIDQEAADLMGVDFK